MALRQ